MHILSCFDLFGLNFLAKLAHLASAKSWKPSFTLLAHSSGSFSQNHSAMNMVNFPSLLDIVMSFSFFYSQYPSGGFCSCLGHLCWGGRGGGDFTPFIDQSVPSAGLNLTCHSIPVMIPVASQGFAACIITAANSTVPSRCAVA